MTLFPEVYCIARPCGGRAFCLPDKAGASRSGGVTPCSLRDERVVSIGISIQSAVGLVVTSWTRVAWGHRACVLLVRKHDNPFACSVSLSAHNRTSLSRAPSILLLLWLRCCISGSTQLKTCRPSLSRPACRSAGPPTGLLEADRAVSASGLDSVTAPDTKSESATGWGLGQKDRWVVPRLLSGFLLARRATRCMHASACMA